MAVGEIGVAELSPQERQRLELKHPEIRQGDSAIVVTAPRSFLPAIEAFARRMAWEEKYTERLLQVMTEDVDAGVLDEARVLQVQRQAQARHRFLQEFPALTSHQVAEMSGSTANNAAAQASRWKAAGKLFAVNVGRADRYPAFQFGDDGKPLRVIEEVLRILEGRSPWAIALWFASHSGWLGGRRPVDHLLDSPDEVVNAARRTVEPLEF
jgi:hypothetical protein